LDELKEILEEVRRRYKKKKTKRAITEKASSSSYDNTDTILGKKEGLTPEQ
jgi:thermostable 8-oxoguanine DNA glycosylase